MVLPTDFDGIASAKELNLEAAEPSNQLSVDKANVLDPGLF
jgi:hypothetical protein